MTPGDFSLALSGPGYGESCLIHLGDDQWMIVDSCIRSATGRSVVLDLMDERGVDPADVCFIVATHWHDDHVRGISQLVRVCHNARFVCSTALASEGFMGLVRLGEHSTSQFSSGVTEMREVFALLASRRSHPMRVSGARRIDLRPTSIVREIWTLSPTDAAVSDSQSRFAHYADRMIQGARAPSWNENDSSVVVQLVFADGRSVLLGADLEHRVGSSRGWHAVLQDTGRPTELATLFKVPHHGSENAHCDGLWGQPCSSPSSLDAPGILSQERTTAIIAPWRNGRGRLPSPAGLRNIAARSDAVHITVSAREAFGDGAEIPRYRVASVAQRIDPVVQNPGTLVCTPAPDAGEWSVEGGVTAAEFEGSY